MSKKLEVVVILKPNYGAKMDRLSITIDRLSFYIDCLGANFLDYQQKREKGPCVYLWVLLYTSIYREECKERLTLRYFHVEDEPLDDFVCNIAVIETVNHILSIRESDLAHFIATTLPKYCVVKPLSKELKIPPELLDDSSRKFNFLSEFRRNTDLLRAIKEFTKVSS